jgi:hypothetical protein
MTEARVQSPVRLDGSNATIMSDGGMVAFSFPREGGYLQPARWQFDDRSDLMSFLADRLNIIAKNGGLHSTVRRHGKYVRRNADGATITTFGDPILDLITNEQGELAIGRERLAIDKAELSQPRDRLGGISSIDLTLYGQKMTPYDTVRAAMGGDDFVLTEASERALVWSSIIARTFKRDGDTMRFRAFKNTGLVHWKMGAEIETWGEHFQEARIESRYLDTVVGQTCAVVKTDSDHDTNDDYLSEYEWGIKAPQPLRVKSVCTARWKGEDFGPMQVERGGECFEVEL